MPALIELLGGLVPALALLGACMAWAFATGAIHIWGATFGKVLDWLAGILPGAVHILGRTILPDLAGAVRSANNGVQDYLKVWRKGAEIEIALSIHLLRLVWQAQAEAVDWLARETAATFDHVIHLRVPKVVRYSVPFALTPFLVRKIVAAVLPFIRARITTVYHVITHDVTHTATRIAVKSASIALPNPWAFPRFRRAWHEIELWRKVTEARLKRLELLLAASGLALAVANMTGTTFKCWRGQGNIARTLRHICGLPRWLLDVALLGTIEAFAVTDLCEFSYLLQKATELQVPVLMDLVSVEDALIGCHGTEKPQLFVLPHADPTPLQGVSPLAA